MKKIALLFLFFLVNLNIFSQKKENFKPGVSLIEYKIMSDLTSKNSILFIFEGDTHLINFYLDLKENLVKRFKNSKVKVDFNYELFSKKPFKSDLSLIPKQTSSKNNYDLICSISLLNFKSFDEHLIKKRKQNYNLNLKFKEKKTNELINTAIINVNSFYTITTQNKNLSKVIYNLISNSPQSYK